jgi:F-type H+-transporting ATPase subunit b
MMPQRFLFVLFAVLAFGALSPKAGYAAADSAAIAGDEALAQTAPEAGPSGATTENETQPASDSLHGAEKDSKGGLPQLNIATYPSQIFWLLVMFAVLYTAFSKAVLPSIASVVDGRDTLIRTNLSTAESLKNEAEAIREAYEKNLEIARTQAVQAIHDVELTSKKKAAEQVEAFRRKTASEIASAEGRVGAAMEKAMDDMTHVAAEVASLAAEKITGIGTDVQNARAIVDSIASKAKAA